MYRFRRQAVGYDKRTVDDGCPFCVVTERAVLEQGEHYRIIANIYPYDVWEGRKVIEHLLLIPRLHVASLHDLSRDARSELADTMGRYEQRGFDVFARAHGSGQRSITDHQHSHLIKTARQPAKLMLYLRKPYLLIRR